HERDRLRLPGLDTARELRRGNPLLRAPDVPPRFERRDRELHRPFPGTGAPGDGGKKLPGRNGVAPRLVTLGELGQRLAEQFLPALRERVRALADRNEA